MATLQALPVTAGMAARGFVRYCLAGVLDACKTMNVADLSGASRKLSINATDHESYIVD